jgi:hypothetical protein
MAFIMMEIYLGMGANVAAEPSAYQTLSLKLVVWAKRI